MKTHSIAPRFNEAIVEQFNENEMVVISGGRKAKEEEKVTNWVCPENGYCPTEKAKYA